MQNIKEDDLLSDNADELAIQNINAILGEEEDKFDPDDSAPKLFTDVADSAKGKESALERFSRLGTEASEIDSIKTELAIKSNAVPSAKVGTSKINSNSERNVKRLLRFESNSSFDGIKASEYDMKSKKSAHSAQRKPVSALTAMAALDMRKKSLVQQKTKDSLSVKSLKDDESEKTESDQTDSTDVNIITVESENAKAGFKKSVMTIIFAKQWTKAKTVKKSKKDIKYQPTFRLEPLINVLSVAEAIETKTRRTLEGIIDKNGVYNTEYTPRFVKILCEMLKSDCKSFKLDRYKFVCFVTALQIVDGQSMQLISKMASNVKTDKSICISSKSKTFYIICVIYFMYKD